MAGVEKLVSFSLSLSAPLAIQKGFGVAGILSFSPRQASWSTNELTRVYTDDTLDGDFAAGTPERIYAAQLFAQEEAGRPEKVQICRGTVAPAMVVDVGVAQVLNTKRYDFMLKGLNSSGASFSSNINYTSDGSANNDEIAAGLAAAVTAAAIAGVSAAASGAGGSQVCRITGAAGVWLAVSLEDSSGIVTGPYNITNNLLTLATSAADPATAIATQLDAVKNERPDFYAILNPYQGKDFATAVASWVESNERILLQLDCSTAAATTVLAGATDFAAAMKTAARTRTAVLHHHKPIQAADAAWAGNRLPATPGTEDWIMSTLKGADPTTLTATHEANLDARNCNYYGFIGADGNTWKGNTASGHALDYIRLRDRVKARCNEALYSLHKGMAARAKKVPGNDDGLLMGRGAITDALDVMVKDGALTSYEVSFPKQADRSTADKDARKVSAITIKAISSSSVRTYEITGIVTQ